MFNMNIGWHHYEDDPMDGGAEERADPGQPRHNMVLRNHHARIPRQGRQARDVIAERLEVGRQIQMEVDRRREEAQRVAGPGGMLIRLPQPVPNGPVAPIVEAVNPERHGRARQGGARVQQNGRRVRARRFELARRARDARDAIARERRAARAARAVDGGRAVFAAPPALAAPGFRIAHAFADHAPPQLELQAEQNNRAVNEVGAAFRNMFGVEGADMEQWDQMMLDDFNMNNFNLELFGGFERPHRHRLFDDFVIMDQDRRGHEHRFRRHMGSEHYYVTARREQKETTLCTICNLRVMNKLFLEHLNLCAESKNIDSKKKTLIYLQFVSDDYYVRQALFILREKLELSYFEAKLDNENLDEMDCVSCKTFDDHMDGKCMSENQREVFVIKANEIGNVAMANYEQLLELKKQQGLDEILSKHSSHFATIEEIFSDAPENLDDEYRRQQIWYEFKKNTVDAQVDEKTKFLEKEGTKLKACYNARRRSIRILIEGNMRKMIQFIEEIKNSETLEEVVQQRRIRRIDQDMELTVPNAPAGYIERQELEEDPRIIVIDDDDDDDDDEDVVAEFDRHDAGGADVRQNAPNVRIH